MGMLNFKGIAVNLLTLVSLPKDFVFKPDVLFIISTRHRWNLSNDEHCSELNKVTGHKLVNLQHACCCQKNVILNKKPSL